MRRWYRGWAEAVGLERSVCDYLAGMTDRFARAEHERLPERCRATARTGPLRRD
jgi:dGTP triphosphohydrolase